MMINIFTIVTTIFFSYLHPFHVSVCDVDFKEESKSIQVSQRIFLDDLEKALNEKYDINLVHDLRKECKKLRYLMDGFNQLHQ